MLQPYKLIRHLGECVRVGGCCQMFRKVMANSDVKYGLQTTLRQMEEAFSRRPDTILTSKPELVAVSKTKPAEDVVEAYAAGQRLFGENYVQELVDKASNSIILNRCPDIKWHYIGHLQTNKINKLLKVPGLHMIETVDSEKLAKNLNSAWERIEIPNKQPLRVLVQVNTSGEIEKNGVKPKEAAALYKYIKNNLANLDVKGVMTIGQYTNDYTLGPNADFITLMQCHSDICTTFCLKASDVLVSMGMSHDFEQAIEMGSSIVRVGSAIFGARPNKNES